MKVAVGLRRVAAGKRTSGRRAAQIAIKRRKSPFSPDSIAISNYKNITVQKEQRQIICDSHSEYRTFSPVIGHIRKANTSADEVASALRVTFGAAFIFAACFLVSCGKISVSVILMAEILCMLAVPLPAAWNIVCALIMGRI